MSFGNNSIVIIMNQIYQNIPADIANGINQDLTFLDVPIKYRSIAFSGHCSMQAPHFMQSTFGAYMSLIVCLVIEYIGHTVVHE